MKNLGAVLVGAATMAGTALIVRAYVALGAAAPDWKVAIDALVAFVAVITAVITYRALLVAADSAEAAKGAAQAARESVESVVRLERAYCRIRYKHETADDGSAIINLSVYNLGRTPTIVSRFAISRRPESENILDPDFLRKAMRPHSFAVAAGDETPLFKIPHKIGSKVDMYVIVHYDDIFGKSHEVRFARRCLFNKIGKSISTPILDDRWQGWS